MPSGIVAGHGKSKADVNYRQHEKCKTCMHFFPQNSCEVVAGNISPEAICDLWAVRPPDGPKDGEFYIREHQRMVDMKEMKK